MTRFVTIKNHLYHYISKLPDS